MKPQFELFDRREFLGVVSKTAAIVGLSTVTASSKAAEQANATNPFAYDIAPFQKTDPKLLSHVEVARWRAPYKEAKRLAVGPDDQLYLCAGNYVSRVNAEGVSGLEIALPEPARCVAVSREGTIFVGLRDHIELFDAKGKRRGSWDSPGKKSWFTGLAVGENEIFAAD